MIGCALLLLLVLFFFKYLCWVGPWTKERSSSHPWCEIKFQSLRKCHSTRVLRRKGRKKKNPNANPSTRLLNRKRNAWFLPLYLDKFYCPFLVFKRSWRWPLWPPLEGIKESYDGYYCQFVQAQSKCSKSWICSNVMGGCELLHGWAMQIQCGLFSLCAVTFGPQWSAGWRCPNLMAQNSMSWTQPKWPLYL